MTPVMPLSYFSQGKRLQAAGFSRNVMGVKENTHYYCYLIRFF